MTRYGIYSDVHGNLAALRAVLSDMDQKGIEKKIFLGDVVGYGPSPSECLHEVRARSDIVLYGNHDLAVGGNVYMGANTLARLSLLWTESVLSEEERRLLVSVGPTVSLDGMVFSHDNLINPGNLRYVVEQWEYEDNLESFKDGISIGFIGHTHLGIITTTFKTAAIPRESPYRLSKGEKALVNVGSVGQPRRMTIATEADTRAVYCIHDTETKEIILRRVPYDVEETVKLLKKHELEEFVMSKLPDSVEELARDVEKLRNRYGEKFTSISEILMWRLRNER